jgi:hypothetical protein
LSGSRFETKLGRFAVRFRSKAEVDGRRPGEPISRPIASRTERPRRGRQIGPGADRRQRRCRSTLLVPVRLTRSSKCRSRSPLLRRRHTLPAARLLPLRTRGQPETGAAVKRHFRRSFLLDLEDLAVQAPRQLRPGQDHLFRPCRPCHPSGRNNPLRGAPEPS